jgi:hypothetical protein
MVSGQNMNCHAAIAALLNPGWPGCDDAALMHNAELFQWRLQNAIQSLDGSAERVQGFFKRVHYE